MTHILDRARRGDPKAAEELLPLVYDELRRIAAVKMAQESPHHTLQPTALVHEAWLRLAGDSAERPAQFENRAHFFGAAAEAMRRILVDSARRKQQDKRGGNPERVELCESQLVAPATEEKLLLVHEALDTLAREDPVKAEIVKLRYFVGLKHQEIADALGLHEKTVRRHWEVSKLRLYELISDRPAPPDALGRGS
jgi:RNA polymerase sigma factor (TIGR02999 family)